MRTGTRWTILNFTPEKVTQEIKLFTGEVVSGCYPNAEVFYCIETGQEISFGQVEFVKLSILK